MRVFFVFEIVWCESLQPTFVWVVCAAIARYYCLAMRVYFKGALGLYCITFIKIIGERNVITRVELAGSVSVSRNSA